MIFASGRGPVERGAGLRADDPVHEQTVPLLEGAHSGARERPEDPVGRDSERSAAAWRPPAPRLPTRSSSTRTSAAPDARARPCAPPGTGSAAATAATTSAAPATRACGSAPGSAASRFARARVWEMSQTSGSVRSRAESRSRPTWRRTGPSRSRSASETRLRGVLVGSPTLAAPARPLERSLPELGLPEIAPYPIQRRGHGRPPSRRPTCDEGREANRRLVGVSERARGSRRAPT